MPELVRLYIRQVAIGFAMSAAVVGGILWINLANLGHLVTTSDMGWIAALMLWVFFGIVLAAVQFGIRVMAMAEEEEDGGDSGHRDPIAPALAPVAVRAGRR